MDSTITQSQAVKLIRAAVKQHNDLFVECGGNMPTKLLTQVDNVRMTDIVSLYNDLPGESKRLHMPSELDGNRIIVIYRYSSHCIIEISSEKVEPLHGWIELLTKNFN